MCPHVSPVRLQEMRHFVNIILLSVICALGILLPVVADEDTDKNVADYRVKIAFIYNFLKFVDWPGDHSPKKTNTAKVCIAGDEGFSEYFKDFQNSHKQNIVLDIESDVHGSNVASCNVLYVGKGQEENASSYLASARRHPVLSISEAGGFTDNGGVIEIVRVGQSVGLFSKDKINLRINMRAAEEDGLVIDARLLQIAAEVIK